MKKEVALFGYSGHAYVVADVFISAGYHLLGYVERQELSNNPYHLEYLGFECDSGFYQKYQSVSFFPAIGDNKIRRKIMDQCQNHGITMATAISPKANISKISSIQEGTLVCQGVCINPLTVIGCGVIINTGAIIEHECRIGDFAHISSGAVLGGNVIIGAGSLIGPNVVIKQGVVIGENVVINSGLLVKDNVPDNKILIV
ncbi:MAG: NeuD/PglB/VioB family sugar acetyltransferase [Bacteroidales bacterium]|nr:NeuD/PglB/VioB family sugar acetyltransferase [Bacteroidales bacterium]